MLSFVSSHQVMLTGGHVCLLLCKYCVVVSCVVFALVCFCCVFFFCAVVLCPLVVLSSSCFCCCWSNSDLLAWWVRVVFLRRPKWWLCLLDFIPWHFLRFCGPIDSGCSDPFVDMGTCLETSLTCNMSVRIGWACVYSLYSSFNLCSLVCLTEFRQFFPPCCLIFVLAMFITASFVFDPFTYVVFRSKMFRKPFNLKASNLFSSADCNLNRRTTSNVSSLNCSGQLLCLQSNSSFFIVIIHVVFLAQTSFLTSAWSLIATPSAKCTSVIPLVCSTFHFCPFSFIPFLPARCLPTFDWWL